MVPRNLENLRQLAKDWNIPSVNSGLIPGLPLFKFYASEDRGSGRVFKPLQLAWGLREEKDDMWGIGILPLVEIIGAIAADKFPSRNALEKEMIKMLRSLRGQPSSTTTQTWVKHWPARRGPGVPPSR